MRLRGPGVPCVRAYGEGQRVSDTRGRPSIGAGWLSALPCGVTHTRGFHPFQHIVRAPPAVQRARAEAGSGLPGVCGLWPAAAEHCRSHLARARGAAPLGGSSHSRRRLLSRWDLGGWAGGPWGHRGAWQNQASTGAGCWAACCLRMQEMWGALALATCGSWYSGVPLSDTGRAAVTPQGPLPRLPSRT